VARKPASTRKTAVSGGSSPALRKYTREIHFNATLLALLRLLDHVDEELNAYRLGQMLSGLSPERFPANQAALYPALRTMRRLKLVAVRQRRNEHGSAQQLFRITPEGRRLLTQLWPAWTSSRTFLDLLEQSTTPGDSSPGSRPQAKSPAVAAGASPARAKSTKASGAATNGRMSQHTPPER